MDLRVVIPYKCVPENTE